MGFSPIPPRLSAQAILDGLNIWSTRAELAIFHEELPWADLLSGMTPEAILQANKVQIVQLMRNLGLSITYMLDLTNGLDRGEEAPALVAAGRSLTEPAVQQLARDYALAVESMLRPDRMGLAAETNLIRSMAPASLYAAVVATAGTIESALAGANAGSRRFVSIQVEHAWGRLGGDGTFVGIAQDLSDFPFISALAYSSYPYFGWADPTDIPADYYTRLRGNSGLPILVSEGGWTSGSLASGMIVSSPDTQARYIARHAQLLDSVAAEAYFQLMFADLDLAALPQPLPANLPLFAQLGLSDSQFAPKPALAQWDALFARPLA